MTNILAGLHGFKPTDTFQGCQYSGDEQAGQLCMGHVCNALQTLQYVNKQDLQIYDHTVQFDDGTVVTAHRCFGQYSADVHVPRTGSLKPGQFYWVPGCVARYDLTKDGKNCISNGDLAGEEMITAVGDADTVSTQTTKTLKDAELPACGASPDGSIIRSYAMVVLPGDTTTEETSQQASGVKVSDAHIPSKGPFSISCIVKLNEDIVPDYSFTEKTNELDCGYTVWNPVKPGVVSSSDGEDWYAECPGNICPIMGSFSPSRFSIHYVNRTNPWPNYNTNFINYEYSQIGYREIAAYHDGEPLLITDYAAKSPYWDKVTTDELKTYEGEYTDFWEKNNEIANSAPYESYCKWKTKYKREYAKGTRVVTIDDNKNYYYGTVYSSEYERKVITVAGGNPYKVGEEVTIQKTDGTVESYVYNEDDSTTYTLITYSIFTIKDYQYKKYIYESNKKITFGKQPFPVCHPPGYMIGMNYCGLFWYNGNHILAGKITNFESEYQYEHIVSDEILLGEYYHVCMTYDEDGETCLYITQMKDLIAYNTYGEQPTAEYSNCDGFGDVIDYFSGFLNWAYTSSKDTPATDWDCSWLFSADMEIGLLRFYHRALSKAEAQLLTQEVFNGTFVADDFEAKKLMAKGYQPVLV